MNKLIRIGGERRVEWFSLSDEDEEEERRRGGELGELEESEREIGEKSEEMESADVALGSRLNVVCPDDLELMDIEGAEMRQAEGGGGFLGFGSSEEPHVHLKYKCPTCGRHYYHDIEAKRRGGCFIATAAYGTPLAEEINVLRKFRDSYLLQKEWGQKFVDAYYTISPPIAEVIKKSENLRKIVRILLRPIIEIFKNKVKG